MMRLNLTIPGREVNDGMLEALKDFLVQHEYSGEYQISIEAKEASGAEKRGVHARSSRHRSTTHRHVESAHKPRITVSARRPTGASVSHDTAFNLEDPEVASKDGKFKFRKR